MKNSGPRFTSLCLLLEIQKQKFMYTLQVLVSENEYCATEWIWEDSQCRDHSHRTCKAKTWTVKDACQAAVTGNEQRVERWLQTVNDERAPVWLTIQYFTLHFAQSSVTCQRRCKGHWRKNLLKGFQSVRSQSCTQKDDPLSQCDRKQAQRIQAFPNILMPRACMEQVLHFTAFLCRWSPSPHSSCFFREQLGNEKLRRKVTSPGTTQYWWERDIWAQA